jgi:ribose/xylose/arabinose/galactoside ABC-type transport system permease subunit
MQTEEILEKENAFDNGKIVMVLSIMMLFYLVLVDNPIPQRHLSGPQGFWPSVVLMGCAAGFITGFILMILRIKSTLLTIGLIVVFTTALSALDRNILINFF